MLLLDGKTQPSLKYPTKWSWIDGGRGGGKEKKQMAKRWALVVELFGGF